MSNLKFILILILLFSFVSSNPRYCDICKNSLKNKYLVDPWGNKFHEYHLENGHFCNILEGFNFSDLLYIYIFNDLVAQFINYGIINDFK